MTSRNQAPIEDRALRAVKLAFIAAYESGEPLHPWLERYPQYTRTLTDLALTLELTPHQPDPSEERIRESVNAVRRVLKEIPASPRREALPSLVARARDAGITIAQLARQVRLRSDILFKLDRGMLRPETVPTRLRHQLAEALACSVDALTAALPVLPTTSTALYYASQAPDAAQQQSFADALTQSDDLSNEDRLFWLAIVQEEGLSM